MELNSKNVRTILLIITFTAGLYLITTNLGLVWGWMMKILGYFSNIIVGLCLAFVLNIPMNTLEKNMLKGMKDSKHTFVRKLQRPLCIFLTLLIAIGAIAFLFLVVIPDLIELLTNLADSFPSFTKRAVEWIDTKLAQLNIAVDVIPEYTVDWDKFFDTIIDFLSNTSGDLVGGAVNVTTSIVTGVSNAILSVVAAVFVLAKKESVEHFVVSLIDALIPQRITKQIYRIASLSYDAFSNFVSGQLIEALSIGILSFIGMLILRIPNAAIIAIIISITAIVPMIGAITGAAVGTLLLLVSNPFKAFVFLIFIIVLQQIDNSLIYPRIVGRTTGLPGLLVFSSVMVGGKMAGLPGTVMAVPVATVIYTLLKELIASRPVDKFNNYRSKSREKTNTDKKPPEEVKNV